MRAPRPNQPFALTQAPEWQVSQWFNAPQPLTLSSLRGNIVVVHAFQMLCPGCVARAIPQAQRVHDIFQGAPVKVIGLHTVFEHHAAMTPTSLEAFLHEYRIAYPVGVDQASEDATGVPITMRRYAMQGTPTTILIDAQGRLRRQVFGAHEDLILGAEIATLVSELEHTKVSSDAVATSVAATNCDDVGCATPDRA